MQIWNDKNRKSNKKKGRIKMSETMKAAVLHGVGDLRCEQVPVPEPGENDVLVKVEACGVCGSDIPRVLTTGTYHFPTIPGHEFGGIVTKAGKNVPEEYVGRRAAVIPLIPCHTCKECEVGQYAQCEHYDFLGSRNDGGFAEYVRVPAANLVFVPDNVSAEAAALLEPISFALHVIENCGVEFGENVVVFGLGAIGIFIAQWAKAFGAKRVFAVDLDEKKIEIAKQIGLEDAVCGKDVDVVEYIMKETNGAGVDAAFEASGARAAFCQAITLLRQQGRLGLVGRPVKPLEIPVESFEKILRSQLRIQGTWSFEFMRFPHHPWEKCLDALSRGDIVTEPIISQRYPLEKTLDAVQLMSDHSEFFFKILIKPELEA